MSESCDPVGAPEIVERLASYGVSVKIRTVYMWQHRREANMFPLPRWQVCGGPAWDWNDDIVPWLVASGRVDRSAIEGGGGN